MGLFFFLFAPGLTLGPLSGFLDCGPGGGHKVRRMRFKQDYSPPEFVKDQSETVQAYIYQFAQNLWASIEFTKYVNDERVCPFCPLGDPQNPKYTFEALKERMITDHFAGKRDGTAQWHRNGAPKMCPIGQILFK